MTQYDGVGIFGSAVALGSHDTILTFLKKKITRAVAISLKWPNIAYIPLKHTFRLRNYWLVV